MYHNPIRLSILRRSSGSYYCSEDLQALIALPDMQLQSLCQEQRSYGIVYYTILDCISGCADAHTKLNSQEKLNFRKVLEEIFFYVSRFHAGYLTQDYWLAFLNTCLTDENITAPFLSAILNASLTINEGLMLELGEHCSELSSLKQLNLFSLKQLKEAICAFVQHRCSIELLVSSSGIRYLTTTTILGDLASGSQGVRRLSDSQLQPRAPTQYDSQLLPSPSIFPRNSQGRILLPPLAPSRVEPVSPEAVMHVRKGPC